MNIGDWLSWLTDESPFIRRSVCGNWPAWQIEAYQAAQLLIAFSYYLIPLALLWLYWKKRTLLPQGWMLLLFILFISLCGTTHLLEYVVFQWAIYRLNTVVALLTALASVVTALSLPVVVKHVSGLPTPFEHEKAVAEANRQALQADILRKMERDRAEAALRELGLIREKLINLQQTVGNQEVKEAVKEIRAHLHQIRQTVSADTKAPSLWSEEARNAHQPAPPPGPKPPGL